MNEIPIRVRLYLAGNNGTNSLVREDLIKGQLLEFWTGLRGQSTKRGEGPRNWQEQVGVMLGEEGGRKGVSLTSRW